MSDHLSRTNEAKVSGINTNPEKALGFGKRKASSDIDVV
jgi:hypothetical protein